MGKKALKGQVFPFCLGLKAFPLKTADIFGAAKCTVKRQNKNSVTLYSQTSVVHIFTHAPNPLFLLTQTFIIIIILLLFLLDFFKI